MNPAPHCIGVIPLGDVPEIAPKVIAAHVSAYLNIEARVLPALELPVFALDRNRLQYDAGLILQHLASNPVKGISKLIALLDVDLFLPVFTHVFGEAQQGGYAALVSMFRLGGRADPLAASPLVMERTAKVALHEICHGYRLAHCQDPRCLMHFSGDLKRLDAIPFFFCRYCISYLRLSVSRNSLARTSQPISGTDP